MEILFEGFGGHASDPVFGWFCIIFGAIFGLITIACAVKGFEAGGATFVVAIFLIVLGFLIKGDNRYPIIKATINDTISWQEINDKYKLCEQTGKIYTFKVKNITNEEWENYLKEKENK